MIYQHPLAYLVGLEGLALLQAWGGDHDRDFVLARLAEVRRLLDDETLAGHDGVLVEPGATMNAYRQWAAHYDEPGNGLFDLDEPVVAEIVDTLPVGTALDAACGTGRLAAHLLERGHRVIGVDSSPEMVQQARDRLPAAEFVLGDLRQLPVADESVDLVVNALALAHVEVLGPVMAEFARVLRPGGQLVISDVHPELVLRGSAVKAVGPDGRPQQAITSRRSVGDFLRAVLAAGFSVRRFDERPAGGQSHLPVPELSDEIGTWRDWPWTLLALVPEATVAAWNQPAVMIWHLQKDSSPR